MYSQLSKICIPKLIIIYNINNEMFCKDLTGGGEGLRKPCLIYSKLGDLCNCRLVVQYFIDGEIMKGIMQHLSDIESGKGRKLHSIGITWMIINIHN